MAAPSPKRPAWLIEESDDKVFSWAKSKRPACWERKEVIGRAKYHGQPILNGKDWEVVSWPSPRSAVWNEFIDWQLAKYRCQSVHWILKQIEELLAGQVGRQAQFSVNKEIVGCAKHQDQPVSMKMWSYWMDKKMPTRQSESKNCWPSKPSASRNECKLEVLAA